MKAGQLTVGSGQWAVGGIWLDHEARELRIDPANPAVRHEFIVLTRAQYAVAAMLLATPGAVVSRGDLLDAMEAGHDRSLDNVIAQLRRFVGPRRIRTRHRVGYQWAPEGLAQGSQSRAAAGKPGDAPGCPTFGRVGRPSADKRRSGYAASRQSAEFCRGV